MMRLQRRLYIIFLVRLLTYSSFRVPCGLKQAYFCAKSFTELLDTNLKTEIIISSLKSSYFKSVGSSLLSHSLWVTLYMENC